MDIKLLSFDLDNTLMGKEEALKQFRRRWKQLTERPLLCYNTGRLLGDVLQLISKDILPKPDYIISGIGTTIYNYQETRVVKAFREVLEEGWNLDTVRRVIEESPFPLKEQPEHFQHGYKSSWYLDEATPDQLYQLEQALSEAELDVHVVYSSARHLDVLPKAANKGNALQWLLKRLNISLTEIIVAGDSGNDNAMVLLPDVKAIIVGNAQPELYQATKHLPVYHAEGFAAEGVIEGLIYYNIFSDDVEEETAHPHIDEFDPSLAHLMDSGEVTGINQDELAVIKEGYHKAIEALKKNITPMGFSACSLTDNESRGTDVNYRSVWSRDGSIAVIGSLPLIDDEAIHTCQRKTLETLLAHMTPNGQLPANVRIDDERPDYSGVGGICSIDSALWVIIAFHAYIEKTRDYDFLRVHFEDLQRAMTWLSAHDGNNDALLEIPEAGDWTDLFGRSYNVLYDEILWYRANICFGRLLGWLGKYQQSDDYMRWSQVIKKEILIHFWPDTQRNVNHPVTFDEQQYSLGDASYLIAQVTPFDFSWRCDVFGNVLAFLFDVLDMEKAGLAFRFMWGVGVNEPYPVVNVYPSVSAGDPDWRDYYTVNLLNLPHHYHNGGIWPFVGGPWVRFINKLGLRELALQELYRLALVNRLGVFNEWEFNEWAHGTTGRPMGKAYQAWSASEYILACHTLNLVD